MPFTAISACGRLRSTTVTRERYKTPEGDVSAEFGRLCQLFQQALPGPADRILFDCLMNEASSLGLNWVEGLEYVVEQRHRFDEARPPTPIPDRASEDAAEPA